MKTTTLSPKEATPKPKRLRMQDDPRFLTLLAGVAGSALSQFEIYRVRKKGDYFGDDLVENLCEDDESRLGIVIDRAWFGAVRLYQRLTKEEPTEAFNEKI
jgi:hypothetical protein